MAFDILDSTFWSHVESLAPNHFGTRASACFDLAVLLPQCFDWSTCVQADAPYDISSVFFNTTTCRRPVDSVYTQSTYVSQRISEVLSYIQKMVNQWLTHNGLLGHSILPSGDCWPLEASAWWPVVSFSLVFIPQFTGCFFLFDMCFSGNYVNTVLDIYSHIMYVYILYIYIENNTELHVIFSKTKFAGSIAGC